VTTPVVSPVTYANIGFQTGFLLVKRQQQGTTVNVYNGDIANVLLVSPSPTPQTSNSVPIQPLTNATIDASQAQYASAAVSGQTVAEVVVSASSQISPSPAQIAAQISALGLATAVNQVTQIGNQDNTNGYLSGAQAGALISDFGISVAEDMLQANAGVTEQIAALLASGSPSGPIGGVPLLRYTQNLGMGTATPVAGAGGTATLLNAAPINQPSIEASFQLNYVSNGNTPFMTLLFTWADSQGNVTTKQVQYVMTIGPSTAPITYYFNGPCFGDLLTIVATNNDPTAANTADLTWAVNQTSHVYLTDKIIQYAYPATAPVGFTNPNGVPSVGMIATTVPTIAAGANSVRLIAVYNGKVGIAVDNLGGANVCRVRVLDPTGNVYGSGNVNQSFFSANVAASSGNYYPDVTLPRGPVTLELHNSGTSGSISPSVTITAVDY